MAKITRIEPNIPKKHERKKVAAYARVSMETELLHHSLSTQVSYFSSLIQSNPEWEYAGVYADEGITGTAIKNRDEFKRLIKDCEAKKIDLVLTKSISRFARNLQECVQTIRLLKELGVTVRFEKEGYDTDKMGGELLLGILATVAQEESNSISQNINWSRRKYVEKGQPWDVARYGYISVGKEHKWGVVEHEAEVVRQAFYMAGMCYTYGEIAEELTRMEAEIGNGRVWNKTPVVNLLRSETYIGNYLSNKGCRVVDEYGVSKWVKNTGQVEQILIEDHHPALVSEDLYNVVQELLDHKTLGGHRTTFSPEEQEIMDRSMKIAATEAKSWKRAG